jgi:hypothetical protein
MPGQCNCRSSPTARQYQIALNRVMQPCRKDTLNRSVPFPPYSDDWERNDYWCG